jgi:hypothetical protein
MTEHGLANSRIIEKSYLHAIMVATIIAGASFAGIVGYLFVDAATRPMVSTSQYHFNVQFRGTNETAMTEVVNNCVIPVLQMYARHPTWKANLEFQALMLEWMSKLGNSSRLTNITASNGTEMVNLDGLRLLKYLVGRDQVQLIVMQYSDALAIAYPYMDFYKSINYTRGLLRQLGIISPGDENGVSRVVLLQEGQFMLGVSRQVLDFKRQSGMPAYDTFLTTRESLSYFGVSNIAPIYTNSFGGEEIFVLPYNPVPSNEGGVIHHLLWFTDGEAVSEGSGSSWLESGYIDFDSISDYFALNPDKMRNHERQLEDLAQLGNIFMTLDEWVAYLTARNEVQSLGRWVPETHWTVFRYRSSFVWMGETQGLTHFDDNEINARNYRTHQVLLATETLLNYSKSTGAITGAEYNVLFSNMTRAWLSRLHKSRILPGSSQAFPRDTRP